MKVGIIGSGIAGLISAAYLAQAGHEVHIFEQYHRLGGVLAPLEEGGYTWDLGQLLIEGLGKGEAVGDILDELGALAEIQVRKDDRRYVFPDFSLDKPEEFQGQKWRIDKLKQLFPEDAKGLDKYYKTYTRIMELMGIGYKMGKSKGAKKLVLNALLTLKMLPLLFKSKWAADKMMDHFFSSKKLQCVFISILADFFVEPSKFMGLGVFALNQEPSFDARMPAYINKRAKQTYLYSVLGGISKMVAALEAVIVKHGGQTHLNALVTKIHVTDGKCVGFAVNDTEDWKFDLVIANGGAHEIFQGLVGEKHLDRGFISHLNSLPLMDGVFMVHLGLDYDPSPQTGGVCTYYYNTYDFEEGISKARSGDYHGGADGFVIHIPSAHTPAMAPQGHASMTIYTICPDRLLQGTWDEKKGAYADELIQHLEVKIPGISSHIVKRVIMTPDDFKTRIHADHFAFGGLAPELGKSGIPFQTCVGKLYYVGAQSQTGGGVNRIIAETATLVKQLIKDLEH